MANALIYYPAGETAPNGAEGPGWYPATQEEAKQVLGIENQQNVDLTDYSTTVEIDAKDQAIQTAAANDATAKADAAQAAAESAIRDGVDASADTLAKVKALIDNINTLLASDDTTLDELQEIVNYIKLNRADLDALGISSIAGLADALSEKISIGGVVDATAIGKLLDFSIDSSAGGGNAIDMYSKSDGDGNAVANTMFAFHQYRPGSKVLQLDHTNSGVFIGLSNARNTNYGNQYGSADYLRLTNTELPSLNASWDEQLLNINRFGYFSYRNWANHILDWAGGESSEGFSINTTSDWDDNAKLAIWKNNGIPVGYLTASGGLHISELLPNSHIDVAFQNGWGNYGAGINAEAKYFKSKDGLVVLQGMVKDGTANQPIFTLPEGMRPEGDSYFFVNSGNQVGSVIVFSDGRVLPNIVNSDGAVTWLSLSGIVFKAA